MNAYPNVLGTIGQTPLIQLGTISKEVGIPVFAKVEAFNPGHSAKDRIAMFMIEAAEKEGRLKPGGTLIEASSGNTGYSLAMVAALKGYKTIITVPDKISKEKLNLLKAMGAKVVICPKEAPPEDPRSYYSRAISLSKEIRNACYLNQNHHPTNAEAHYRTTGPEIWKQTEGRITHFLCASGTGGTISGTARFLKEMNPDIQIIGIDAYGSVLKKYHETNEFDPVEIYSNTLEGVGKSIIPGNTAFDLIDQYIKVSDRESALMARQLARDEGILVGYSSGAVAAGLYKLMHIFRPEDRVVLLFSDHGSRYLSKIFDDEWMQAQGFIDPNEVDENELDTRGISKATSSVRRRVLTYFRDLVESANILP
ncbi:MAG: cysteine synthase family protein [Saprospiraceae bacterium]|nr:cysteine synthase family protein [Saprospiraceae bacterium]